jgi:nitrate/nitrite-specific signal transduction histidine kinase
MQQAAISMETAKLYQTLESKVQQRTSELNQAMEVAKEANKAKSTFLANSQWD